MEGAIGELDLDRMIRPHGRRVVYHRGEYVYLPGDPSDALYLIIEGRVKLSYPGQDGRRLTLMILEEGELFGEMALAGSERRELMAEVLERTSVRAIDKRALLQLLRESTGLSLQIMEVLLLRLRRLEERVIELLLHDRLIELILAQVPRQDEEELEDIRATMAEGAIVAPSPPSQAG